jgi:hypothetical protein
MGTVITALKSSLLRVIEAILSFGTKAYLNPDMAFGQGDVRCIKVTPEAIFLIEKPFAYVMGIFVALRTSGNAFFFLSLHEKRNSNKESIIVILMDWLNIGIELPIVKFLQGNKCHSFRIQTILLLIKIL